MVFLPENSLRNPSRLKYNPEIKGLIFADGVPQEVLVYKFEEANLCSQQKDIFGKRIQDLLPISKEQRI